MEQAFASSFPSEGHDVDRLVHRDLLVGVAVVIASRSGGRVIVVSRRLAPARAQEATSLAIARARRHRITVVMEAGLKALGDALVASVSLSEERRDLLAELVDSVREMREASHDRRWQTYALLALLLTNTGLLLVVAVNLLTRSGP